MRLKYITIFSFLFAIPLFFSFRSNAFAVNLSACANPGDRCCTGDQGGTLCKAPLQCCTGVGSCGSIPIGSCYLSENFCDDLKSIKTAIGCIDVTNTNSLAGFILRWGIGIIGGIAFVLIIIASIMITTSTGDPKRLQSGKELLTAAIAGVLFLIFSVFILRLIGLNIFLIPIFG